MCIRDRYAACEFVLNTNKINLSDSKLYMNVERAEQAEKQAGNDYFAIPSATAVSYTHLTDIFFYFICHLRLTFKIGTA